MTATLSANCCLPSSLFTVHAAAKGTHLEV
jgi:hypothetical protein